MDLHCGALVVAVGDHEHDHLAFAIDVSAIQYLVVNPVEFGLYVWVKRARRDCLVQFPFPELLGDQGFKINLRLWSAIFVRGVNPNAKSSAPNIARPMIN